MTISQLRRLVRALGFAAVFAGGAACVSYPSAPSDPAFDTDVLPIFEAHCNRCHGNGPDGGSENNPPGPDQPYGPPIACFTQFGLNPDAGAGGCASGANSQVPLIHIYLNMPPSPIDVMPPPPAPPLNSYELGVVNAWLAESPRICSRSSNPDPALFCP